jgi:hypothetical protein
VKKDARLGEHIHVATKARSKDTPVRRSSASVGISASSHPGSVGQCIGARCWSVISSRRFGGRGGSVGGTLRQYVAKPSSDSRPF